MIRVNNHSLVVTADNGEEGLSYVDNSTDFTALSDGEIRSIADEKAQIFNLGIGVSNSEIVRE